jgi:predicted dithiol-disulfide oxidoreductase (DUF899 family)
MTNSMSRPPVVSAEEWQQARDELLVLEKAHTRATDALAARRRRLPMVKFDGGYPFEGPDGSQSLLDLFEGRSQLVVYHFMDLGPDRFCPGCTNFTNNVRNLAEVHKLGISFVLVSTMPLAQIEAYKKQQGWTLPFLSCQGTTFHDDCHGGGGFRLTVFLRDGDEVFLTYDTTGRGVDHLLFDSQIADLTPYGRQEAWEDSPPGWPQQD